MTASLDRGSAAISSRPRMISALRWAPIAIVGVALVIHIPTFDQPLLERHGFRQTQTAYTARIFHEQGIDLLHPLLPILGPPWEVPFEFPLFQASAAVVMDAGVAEDTAMRVTGFAWFVVSAGLLWLLVRRQAGPLAAVISLAVFALSPLAMEWSRASMIEYLPVAASLGFALAGLHWRERPSTGWYLAALLLGCTATMVKITTAAFWVAPFALLGFGRDDVIESRRSQALAWCLAGIPIFLGLAWTRYADSIKGASAATSGLTSTGVVDWIIGDVTQRVDPGAWAQVVLHVIILTGAIALPLLALPISRFARRRRQRRFWSWIAVTLVGPILAFFNLYVQHDYYALAVSASAAACIGLGFAELGSASARSMRVIRPLAVALTAGVWIGVAGYWAPMYAGAVIDPEGVLPLATQIENETNPNQPVAILGRWYSPTILYYAHRWGYMLPEPDGPPELVSRLLSEGWAVYSCPFGPVTACARVSLAVSVVDAR